MDFILAPPSEVSEIDEGYIFDVGNLSIEVLHTPGHSPGSISLLTNKGELFPGDLVHYGSVFLPKKKYLNIVIDSLQRIINLFDDGKVQNLYPAHGDYPQDKELVVKLFEGINNLDEFWDQKQKDKFLRSWIIDDGTFKYVLSRF